MTIDLQLGDESAQRSLTQVADKVLSAKRIVFVSGAGISCSAGIPDFRSLNGLYQSEQSQSVKGKDLFDVSLFNDPETTSLFYRFMAELRRKTQIARPTATHRFLKTLKDRGSLVRTYTQNIDGLEAAAGLNLAPLPLKGNDCVQLHGDIHTLKCTLCSDCFPYNDQFTTILQAGEGPDCPTCADKCAMRVALGRRAMTVGRLRPDVVLYGEAHPAGERIAQACAADLRRKPDCLIIAGTSLKIPGLKRLVKDFAKSVHEQGGIVVFVNLSQLAMKEWTGVFDYQLLGTSDAFVELLRTTRPTFFARQATLTTCKARKPANSKTGDAVPFAASKKLCNVSAKANIKPIMVPTSNEKLKLANVFDNKENIAPVKRALEDEQDGPQDRKRRLTRVFVPREVAV